MPRLSMQQGNDVPEVIELLDGETILGRDAGCDVVLADSAISRRHLKFRTVMGDAFLEDLGSANGTFVNGRLVKKCVLNDGDVIQVGGRELLYQQPEANEADGADADGLDKTRLIKPGDFGPRTTAAREAKRTTQGVSPMQETEAKARVKARVKASKASALYEGMRDIPEPEPTGFWARLKKFFGG